MTPPFGGHPERSWSTWAELGGLIVVPILAGVSIGMTVQASFEFVASVLYLLRFR
ncbi:MAG: hypothetical protein ABI743_04325 [bacterium]